MSFQVQIPADVSFLQNLSLGKRSLGLKNQMKWQDALVDGRVQVRQITKTGLGVRNGSKLLFKLMIDQL